MLRRMTHTRIRVVFPIACPADVAWRQAHSPAAAAALYRPLLTMEALTGEMPERFLPGTSIDVSLKTWGGLPAGTQRISIDDVTRHDIPAESRTMRDSGRPLTGPLALLRGWNHEISIWPMGQSAAVWHDELTLQGAFAPLAGLVLRPMWWWRKYKLQQLARDWASEAASA